MARDRAQTRARPMSALGLSGHYGLSGRCPLYPRKRAFGGMMRRTYIEPTLSFSQN
jgi:hypothetical protein